jgi:hypothetical protein
MLPFTTGQYGYAAEVTSAGDMLAVLLAFLAAGLQRIQESRVYVVDPRTGSVHLTYLKVWDDVPAGLPIVTMLKPSSGAKLSVGVPVTLEAAADAGRSAFPEFEFLVNGKSIGPAQRGNDAASVSLGQLEWTPELQGTFSISARVRTWEGAASSTAGDESLIALNLAATVNGIELRFQKPAVGAVILERSDSVLGPWSQIQTASESATFVSEGESGFFRLRAIP